MIITLTGMHSAAGLHQPLLLLLLLHLLPLLMLLQLLRLRWSQITHHACLGSRASRRHHGRHLVWFVESRLLLLLL